MCRTRSVSVPSCRVPVSKVRAGGVALVVVLGLLVLGVSVKTSCVVADEPKSVDLGAQVLAQLDSTYKDLAKRQLLSNREATAPLAQLEALAWELVVVSNQYVEQRQQSDVLQRRVAIAQKTTQDQTALLNDLQAKIKALEEQLKTANKLSQKPPDDVR